MRSAVEGEAVQASRGGGGGGGKNTGTPPKAKVKAGGKHDDNVEKRGRAEKGDGGKGGQEARIEGGERELRLVNAVYLFLVL